MTKHAPIEPSSFDIWFNCPGYIEARRFAPKLLDQEATEGNVAHALLARHYKTGIAVRDLARINPDVDDDMVDACQLFVECFPRRDGAYSELTLPPLDIMPRLYGTPDYFCMALRTDVNALVIADLKYGRDYVSAEANGQLLIYAILAAAYLKTPVDLVILCIVQPRVFGADAVRNYEVSYAALMAWTETTLLPAYTAATDKYAHRVPGPHCKHAACKTACPEYLSWCMGIIEPPFADTPNRIANILTVKKSAEKLFELAELEGTRKLESGESIDGFKLVKKIKHATIAEPELCESELLENGASDDQIFTPPKLKTPAKLIETFTLQPALKRIVEKHKFTPEGGTTIAPLSDRRPAVATAAEVFKNG